MLERLKELFRRKEETPLPAARNVDSVFIDGWEWTLRRRAIPQYAANVKLQWTDVEGERHEHEERCLFPNLFERLSPEQQQDLMQQAAMMAVRANAGVDRPGAML